MVTPWPKGFVGLDSLNLNGFGLVFVYCFNTYGDVLTMKGRCNCQHVETNYLVCSHKFC